MKYAICTVPVAPMRTSHDHRSEMSSQVIFGEQVKIIASTAEGWAQVECCNDGYIGYCRMNQFYILDKELETTGAFAADWVQPIEIKGQKLMVPMGADLSLLETPLSFPKPTYDGNAVIASTKNFSEGNIKNFSLPYMNTAYLWGGRTIFGIDCSGFVQAVFRMMNISLKRDANQQVNEGEGVGFLEEAKCGDLAFFDDEEARIIHVGILLDPQQIIHASGIVRIDTIDNLGIINSSTGRRTHKLRVIKRMKELQDDLPGG